MSKVSPIPEGMNSLIPYLVLPDTVKAMAFYNRAFGATEIMRMPGPGGHGTMHAEMKFGNSTLMLTDENPQREMKSPATLGGSPVSLMFYVEDVDKVIKKAVAAGCEIKFPASDMFWGDRMGKVSDPFGYHWSVATHIEDVPEDEMPQRQAEWLAQMQSAGDCN